MTPSHLALAAEGALGRDWQEALQTVLGVNERTVRRWLARSQSIPAGVVAEIEALLDRQRLAVAETQRLIRERLRCGDAPDQIEIGFPADDHEAQTLGWPCAAAWWGMARGLAMQWPSAFPPLALVPRGSTAATAAAVDEHER